MSIQTARRKGKIETTHETSIRLRTRFPRPDRQCSIACAGPFAGVGELFHRRVKPVAASLASQSVCVSALRSDHHRRHVGGTPSLRLSLVPPFNRRSRSGHWPHSCRPDGSRFTLRISLLNVRHESDASFVGAAATRMADGMEATHSVQCSLRLSVCLCGPHHR